MPYNSDKTPWAADTTALALQEIRERAITDLKARDERLSEGQMNAANHYSPYHEVQREDGRGSNFVVDPVLSKIRHTGEDTILLTFGRWATFTAEPQDETPYRDKLNQRNHIDRLEATKNAARAVEDSLKVTRTPDTLVVPKGKPKQRDPLLPKV